MILLFFLKFLILLCFTGKVAVALYSWLVILRWITSTGFLAKSANGNYNLFNLQFDFRALNGYENFLEPALMVQGYQSLYEIMRLALIVPDKVIQS